MSQIDPAQSANSEVIGDLNSLLTKLSTLLENKDYKAAQELLEIAKTRYESVELAGESNLSLILQIEATLSDLVCTSSAGLEEYIHKINKELRKSVTQGVLHLLPQTTSNPSSKRFPHGVSVDLCALADRFQASHPAHFPPTITNSLYSKYSLYLQREQLQSNIEGRKTTAKKKDTTASGESVAERQRYEKLTMRGAELQEQRKLALLHTITTMSQYEFYPMAHLFLKDKTFTETIHALFDITQLYVEGSISIRKYTDEQECARIYAQHNICIDRSKYEYETLYVRSKEAIDGALEGKARDCYLWTHEFSPTIWKGITSVLSMDIDRAKALAAKFGIS